MKQKIKVYQTQVIHFDKKGNFIPRNLRTYKVVCIGTVITPKNECPSMQESIWALFNWTYWDWGKLHEKSWIYGIRNGIRCGGFRMFPTIFARGFCNSDIFFFMKNKWYAAAHFGFETFDSKEEAIEFCKENCF